MKKILASFPAANETVETHICHSIESLNDLKGYKKKFPSLHIILARTFIDLINEGKKIIVQPNGAWCLPSGKLQILEYLDIPDKKKDIEHILLSLFKKLKMNKPSNFDDILEFVYEDVCETADKINWSDGDVVIAFRRWIEKQS